MFALKYQYVPLMRRFLYKNIYLSPQNILRLCGKCKTVYPGGGGAVFDIYNVLVWGWIGSKLSQ